MWEVVQQTKKAEHINTGVQFKKLFHMGKGDKEIYYCSITVISCEHKERLGSHQVMISESTESYLNYLENLN